MSPSLTLYDDAVSDFLNTGFEIETLANDCLFTEGPVWNREGFYLFSDITANTVYKLEPGKPKEIFIANSGTDSPDDELLKPDQVGSNGLAYDAESNLLVCRHGSHQVAKWNGSRLLPFLSNYNGRPFNSPNDLVVHPDGSVFFSDPPYGLKDGKLNPEVFQPKGAVYCYRNGALRLFCDQYQYPNGVCLSPDASELYVCSNKPFENFISVYDAATLNLKRLLARENSDGITCDLHGNVYLCNRDGLLILNSQGKRLALIALSTVPANCCWGGAEGKDLLITARENVFRLRNLLR